MITLRNYQSDGIDRVASLYAAGTSKIVFQLPTGGGKTVCFSGMAKRYLQRFSKSVLICVHREELLRQTRKTLYNGFGLLSEPIRAGKLNLRHSNVYVGMVETMYNRLKKNPDWAKKIGMLIVDECHIGNFKKLYDFFPHCLVVGFSATPISSSKKDPLKNYFQEIVCGPQISDLIHLRSLCPNETYSIKGINRKNFGVKRGEFDNKQMSGEYSNVRHVQNTVDAYHRLCEGKKTMVFNCSIQHSILVNEAFINAGLNSRHLDGSEPKEQRAETLKWFKETPNAILNNIGVLTTGFDEPSVINVIVNRSTMSMALWLQMTGRGARPFPGKDYFRIIDMGGNALYHGDWSSMKNWEDVFHFPHKPSEAGGVAPIKECEKCEAIIPASATVCSFCGHIHERIINYDTIAPEFELLVGRIDVTNLVQKQQNKDQKEWKVFFDILQKTTTMLKYRIGDIGLTDEEAQKSFTTFESKVKEWRKAIGKPYSRYTKEFALEKFNEQISNLKKQTA